MTVEAVLPIGGDDLAIVNDTNFGSTGRNPACRTTATSSSWTCPESVDGHVAPACRRRALGSRLRREGADPADPAAAAARDLAEPAVGGLERAARGRDRLALELGHDALLRRGRDGAERRPLPSGRRSGRRAAALPVRAPALVGAKATVTSQFAPPAARPGRSRAAIVKSGPPVTAIGSAEPGQAGVPHGHRERPRAAPSAPRRRASPAEGERRGRHLDGADVARAP